MSTVDFKCPLKGLGFLRVIEKPLKVGSEGQDSIFEIEDQILRIIEV